MYYSTPGALKVQGLAARKVTAGSPLNSCKLSTGSGEAGAESAGAWLLGGSPSAASPPPTVWKEFLSWMLETVEGSDYIVIWPGLCKTAGLLVFLPVLAAER